MILDESLAIYHMSVSYLDRYCVTVHEKNPILTLCRSMVNNWVNVKIKTFT